MKIIHGKFIFLFFLGIILVDHSLFAQNMSINSTGNPPNSKSMLDIDATGKGLLIPRMTWANRPSGLTAAENGLIFYSTDGDGTNGAGFYSWNGSAWSKIGSGAGWSLTGNALTGTLPASPTEWIGSSNAADWIVKTNGTERIRVQSTGNVGIGGVTPASAVLQVNSGGSTPLYLGTSSGYTFMGALNAGWSHFYTDRARYYFNTGGTFDSGNIGSYDEDLSLQTSGTTRISVLNSDGNVGIGSTTPGAKLDVVGNLQVNSTTGAWGGWYNAINFPNASHAALVYPTGGLLFGLHSNTNFYWANTTGGWYSMILDNSGQLDVRTGYKVNGAAPSGNYLRGDGTRFVANTIQPGDLPSHTHPWSQVTSKPAAWLDAANLIQDLPNFNNSVPSGFYQGFSSVNSPSATWYNLLNVRHSNTANDHGFQIAASYYDPFLWARTYQGGTGANNGTFTPWVKILTTGNSYGSNIQNVKLASTQTTTSSSYVDLSGMTLTFTPIHSTVYVYVSANARLTDNSGFAQNGLAALVIRVWNSNTGAEVAAGRALITDYDDWEGVVVGGTAAINNIGVAVTPGASTTLKIQWYIEVLAAASPWQLRIQPGILGDHCIFTIVD